MLLVSFSSKLIVHYLLFFPCLIYLSWTDWKANVPSAQSETYSANHFNSNQKCSNVHQHETCQSVSIIDQASGNKWHFGLVCLPHACVRENVCVSEHHYTKELNKKTTKGRIAFIWSPKWCLKVAVRCCAKGKHCDGGKKLWFLFLFTAIHMKLCFFPQNWSIIDQFSRSFVPHWPFKQERFRRLYTERLKLCMHMCKCVFSILTSTLSSVLFKLCCSKDQQLSWSKFILVVFVFTLHKSLQTLLTDIVPKPQKHCCFCCS